MNFFTFHRMMALRASANASNFRLERKLWYEYAKLVAKGQLRTILARVTPIPVVSSSGQALSCNLIAHTTTYGKRLWSQDDRGYDVHYYDTFATSPDRAF